MPTRLVQYNSVIIIMSDNYAARLKKYPKKGKCGLPEMPDTFRARLVKMKKLVELFKNSQRVVVITGAGISTSAGIPDFRGPNGIWTKEQQRNTKQKSKNKRKRSSSEEDEEELEPVMNTFSSAKPTLTHRAITKLVQTGKVAYCVVSG